MELFSIKIRCTFQLVSTFSIIFFFKVYIMAPSAYKNKKQPLALTIAKVWGKNQL